MYQKKTFKNPDNIIQLGYEPNRIDLIVQLEGLDFESCFLQRQDAIFEGIPIYFIGYQDLIKNKRSSGRLKDKLDVKTLEKKNQKKNT